MESIYVSAKTKHEGIARSEILRDLARDGWTDMAIEYLEPRKQYKDGRIRWSGKVTGTPPARKGPSQIVGVERPGSGGWSF